MKDKKNKSIQDWLPIENIFNNGIIKLKNSNYIKILKIKPINFNLKSDIEKESILNSYKLFFKTCDFNMQILIQSNKEDLTKHNEQILKQLEKEEKNKIKELGKNYIQYVKEINKDKKSSSKNFYILIKNSQIKREIENTHSNDFIFEELNDNYFKIKECLFRCGNIVYDYRTKEEIEEVLFSFLNTRIYLNKI